MKTEKQLSDEDINFKNDNDRIWLAFLHFSGILPLFLPSIYIWNRKKADIKEISEHFRSVIALQSFIFFIYLLSLWGCYKTIGRFEAIFGILFLGVFFSIWNALRVLNGRPFKLIGIFKNKNDKTKRNSK
ncbi:MAG: DUF4870 domain-containing protein [Bacteroidales bacterium]|nr:DUF4870 domain-containing protein [Bacteroidales bacterium]